MLLEGRVPIQSRSRMRTGMASPTSRSLTTAMGTPGISGIVSVLLGNGDGTFQPYLTYGSGGFYPAALALADVNGDGKPDLLVANYCADSSCVNGSVGVLINTSGTAGAWTLKNSSQITEYSSARFHSCSAMNVT